MREITTTGISASDRAATVLALIDDQSGAQDFIKPGHVFPLKAVKGGVLERSGHTEGTVDLARICGLKPAGVICEILKEDGAMMRLKDLRAFANLHGLKMTSVAEVVNIAIVMKNLFHWSEKSKCQQRWVLFDCGYIVQSRIRKII